MIISKLLFKITKIFKEKINLKKIKMLKKFNKIKLNVHKNQKVKLLKLNYFENQI